MSTTNALLRADVADFSRIPDALKELPRWELWKVVDGNTVLIDARSGRNIYGRGMGATFAEAIAYFVSHADITGLFFRCAELDDWPAMLHSAQAAGVSVTHEYVTLVGRVRR